MTKKIDIATRLKSAFQVDSENKEDHKQVLTEREILAERGKVLKKREQVLVDTARYLKHSGDLTFFEDAALIDIIKTAALEVEEHKQSRDVRWAALYAIGCYFQRGGKVEPFVDTLRKAASADYEKDPITRRMAVYAIKDYLDQPDSKVELFADIVKNAVLERHESHTREPFVRDAALWIVEKHLEKGRDASLFADTVRKAVSGDPDWKVRGYAGEIFTKYEKQLSPSPAAVSPVVGTAKSFINNHWRVCSDILNKTVANPDVVSNVAKWGKTKSVFDFRPLS